MAETETADPCEDCGHIHTPSGCTGPPTPSDLWAGVSVAGCDCDFDTTTPPAPESATDPRACVEGGATS